MSPSPTYKVYFASRDAAGEPWCPGCRAIDSTVASTFNHEGGPQAEIIYVGQREEWKKIFPAGANNPHRKAPWSVTGVPTILKVSPEGQVVGRIEGDDDILNAEKLEKFLKE